MKFTKMHGIGNDYVYVDCTLQELENPEETARLVSHRHKGIGSDGLILIKKSLEADFEMVMYNGDGCVATASAAWPNMSMTTASRTGRRLR